MYNLPIKIIVIRIAVGYFYFEETLWARIWISQAWSIEGKDVDLKTREYYVAAAA
ncbi:hypothetical protein APX70_05977, partial [Pseudomonas syringae pv. maculicola]